jgi:DNA polymerase-3 subunit alpha
MAALMSSVVGNKEKLAAYLSDCRKLEIEVLPPSLNKSGKDFNVLSESQVIFGLSAINGIGESIAEAIILGRDEKNPYSSVYDFFRRCDPATLKKSTLEHLAYAGALDELFTVSHDGDLTRRRELELLEKEKAELGIYVSKHPIEGMWTTISPNVTGEIIDILEISNGANVKVGGILTAVKRMITKKGQKMFRLLVEDLSGEIEVIIFPRESKTISDDFFSEGDVVIVSGTINRENEEESAIVKMFYNSSENGKVV